MFERTIPAGNFDQRDLEIMKDVYDRAITEYGLTSDRAKEHVAKIILSLCQDGVPNDLSEQAKKNSRR